MVLIRVFRMIGVAICIHFLCVRFGLADDLSAEQPVTLETFASKQDFVPTWMRLAEDKVHDPSGPAINELQYPGEILSRLPKDTLGNQVRWVTAMQSGAIKPRRSRLLPEDEIPVLDMDVLLNLRGSAHIVRFPHLAHTQWLSCNNCHEDIFKTKIGESKIGMINILSGEKCGLCHGAVSFPLIGCGRCHSVSRYTQLPYRAPGASGVGAVQ
ncbi:MAG: hypothetical protein HY306_12665 [Nitrosomonadales bacterium]|nr:hypothetical protein [Nitrosomonadales bacterium]